jgi:hypothetical protein
MTEWISVDERLPEENGDYLCTWHCGSIAPHVMVYIGRYSDKYKRFSNMDWNYVTHWMPLPQPPDDWRPK